MHGPLTKCAAAYLAYGIDRHPLHVRGMRDTDIQAAIHELLSKGLVEYYRPYAESRTEYLRVTEAGMERG